MTKKREQELLKMIESLEARVRELESRPSQQIHYHTYSAPSPMPMFPAPYYVPHAPSPWNPLQPWCSGNVGIGVASPVIS